ncbi:MAG: hypothetical protein ACETWK_10525 [Candidatus Aminicenantaceae bacterium]
MRQIASIFLLLIPIYFINSNNNYGDGALGSHADNQTELERILKKCSDYCERVAHSALFFVCEEKIEEVIYDYTFLTYLGRYRIRTSQPQKVEKNIYIYDYQLIKKGRKIEERRILLEENGKKKYEKNARLKTKRIYSRRTIFGPVGLLSKDSQDMYNYKILGEKTIKGRKSFVIEAKPKWKIKDRPNYGKLWIDKEDSSVLKIETDEESLVGFDIIKEKSKREGVTPILRATHYYNIEKNGVRFPSKTVFEEDYRGAKIRGRKKRSKTIITYDKYRFFTVEVKIKY